MLIQVLTIISPIILIVLTGYLYAKKYETDMSISNRLTIDLFLPALILSVLSSEEFQIYDYRNLALGALLIIFISGLIAFIFAKINKINIKTFVPPMMYTNTGNIGLPLALFAFGKSAIPAALVLFIIENTLHFTLGIKTLDKSSSIIGVLRNPIVLAAIFGLLLNSMDLSLPEILLNPITMIGDIAIPLMLFSLGVRLVDINLDDWKIGAIGALFRPISGLIALAIVIPWINIDKTNQALLVIFAILPPAVLNFMVSEKYNQEPKKVAALVLFGNLFSVITISLALYLLMPTLTK